MDEFVTLIFAFVTLIFALGGAKIFGRRRRLSGAKRRLLKIVRPPKAARWREAPPFENCLAAEGGLVA